MRRIIMSEKEIKINDSTLVHEINTWVNQSTGEIIETFTVTKKIGRQGFAIEYLSTIMALLEVGGKKMQVVKCILKNLEFSSNTLIITTRELAEKSGTGLNTVIETLKILEKNNIIKRKTGSIMVNPQLLHKGNKNKERALLTRFTKEWDSEEKCSNTL